MGAAAVDSSQWLSVKEETIFLHDGLIRVTDLAELPSEIGVSEPGDSEQEILTFETKNPVELAEKLRAVCGNQSNAYARLLEYRLNALRGLWGAQRQLALEEQQDRESAGDEETLALLKRQGLLQQPEQAPFTSRVGLLLVFPLLQSQSRSDPALCSVTAEVLLACLRDCQPLSLTKEPADCLNGLESLLCSWLEEQPSSRQHVPQRQKENAAAALVALACARGSLKTLIHTVHLLQKQTDLGRLPVADVLYRLLLLEGGPGSPSCLLGGKHIVSWGFEDMLPAPDSSAAGNDSKDADLGRCLATDGLYLYTTNSFGKGISKLGSGLHGTLRGFVYCRNEELEPGWIAFGSGRLLHRPASFDSKPHYLFQVIDPFSLQVCQIVPMPANHFPVGSSMTTVHLCSDGTYVYWIWSPASLNEKTHKGHSVFMDVFELATQNGTCSAGVLQERTILMRKEGESSKCLNELLLSRMSRFRASHSATLAALTGSTITNTLKEEQSAVNTSCGLPLKTLRKTPMYTCGTYLVMLVSPPGVSGSSATRSLFGGTSGLSSLKILSSSLVFSIADGQFTSRADLIDAAGSSLGRGALVPGLGACYDALNNLIWTCSSDYMDQWSNPGNQAFHHVCQRLGVSHIIKEPKEEAVHTSDVINQLLHHVGAMCIHQLNVLAASSNIAISTFLGKQHPIEAQHFSSICDIMEKAMVNGDTCIIRCILVVFQVVFRFFSPQTEQNQEMVRRAGLLLWQLLMAPIDQIGAEIQKEVCLAISSGLNTLYPGEAELNNLLKLVLTEGERNDGLSQLRDVILTHLADQLQKSRFGSEDDEHYRLNDELLHYILKTVVRESCILITKCQTVSKDDFQKLLSTVPVASPSLCYLMAVQNHLLSNTVLIRPDENDDSDSSLQGETMKELQTSILSLATKILVGCDEVLETLQQVTTALINSDIQDRESRLKGLEQVTKATMLGHLLPVLLTSLMHPNLQTLILADALMPQLVQLVLYTSQTALLLKTQAPLFSDPSPQPGGATLHSAKLPVADDSFHILEEREEPGFLTGLKIPAPWAAGKTVETVHPVRDNYKFKETVHIPGARCLYLRFDPRCSSQYDYDKLVIYAGPNTNSRKVAEYGGNTLGYGSRSVLGTGWPKDLVKVEGDTVTFSFEMRSGREHNTPDKAMWGFSCTVRAQESSEDVSGGLPFLADLALGLSVLACSMLRILYSGPEITREEEACQDLLCSKLLQRSERPAAGRSIHNTRHLGFAELLYTVSEEKCLVRSGLVQLMDRLCSLSGQRDCSSNDKQTKKQKVATMAWAAFQVLANRCIEWEKVEGGSTDAVHSGLARQVSSLLTNHLARATECCGNQAAGNDALQDVLSLLNDLSRSHIGKAILSQPACVSKLLSLLLDQRPSPKLVLIILQLCRAALPLMSVEDCGNVELPPWSYSIHTLDNEQEDSSDPASKIASLLLAKLADYVVPGCQTLLSPSSSEPDTSLTRASPKSSLKVEKDAGEEGEAVDGKLSIFIHKREDQSSHEVLQPLLSSSEGRPFRLGTGANMEKVVKMDRDMTKSGHCEVITEEAAAALRKATKWAQSGLIVSVGPPVETLSQENASGLSTGDKKKTAQTAICRERNTELARSDPVRPFISGHVANSMAAEVIALLHGLLTAPESNTAQIWTSTAEKVLSRALMYIPQLGKYAESILENGSSSGRKLARLQATARQAVAALCALGGFKETIKIGSEVQVVGKGILGSVGVVMSINEQEGIATVKFPSSDYRKDCKASDVLTVPISRLCTPRSEALPLYKLSITEKVVQAVQSMLLPQEGSLSIHTSLPASGDGSSPVMAAVRLLAEIRTRACLVMAQLLEDSSFCEEFIQQCPAAVEVLNLVAQECSPGERLSVVEAQCERVRMLYRDCARPPPPPLQTDRTQPKEITWSPSRVFPPVRACMFSSRLTSVTFLADPSAGGGLPRGTFIYATSPVPVQAPSFYWEIEIVSYGDSDDDSGPIVSFGFATEAEKRDGAWTNPVGTCLFHNNGRAVHYNGSSLLQWKSVRLDVALVPGDVAGIGWERSEGTPPPPGQAAKGRVYFTYCGQRLAPFLEDVSGGMWPLVHIQKKNTKIRANFGCRPFAFAEGQAHRNAADMCIDLAEEISANFEALPFAMASDSDNDAGASVASDPGSHGPPCRIAAVATALQQYNSGDSCHYKLELSYENLITSGPDPHPPPIADDESDDDEDDDIPREDHYALLVKAWETKVFPTIRRRFRNEAERKSGLDQIKGALQLGMVDIARQTVEFLYEENGGIPRDLYLPTIEDIKDEANKFTIDKVRKGLTVVIRCPDSNNTNSTTGGTALPKFAIRGMLKTFGLHGVVLDVDSMNELVQVETYLRSEGVLVRYWYPIDMLERPPAGSRRTAANGLVTLDSTNIQIHRELLRCEGALARLYCRMALLNIFAPKSPHTFTRLFHIPAIRDITLEHLQLLSNQLLAPPLPDGTISSSSILLAQSLQHIIQGQNCSPTDLFYQGNAQPIREWLTVAITRALHQGEESLLDLTKQICSFLQNAPEQFPSEEFPVSESKVSMDVNFPGAAFVVISCKESTQGFRKDSSLYKAPWARVMIYGLGHKVRRNGQLNLMEAVCYPLDASPSNTGLTPPPTTNQYPSAIIPTDKVHIKLGVSPPPGAVLVLHSLPLEFPLAMAFAEQLLTWKLGEGNGRSEDELDTIPASVLLQVVELLGGLLWTTDLAASVKELIFHLLSELFRKIHHLEQRKMPTGLSSSIALLLNPCLAVLMALQTELRKLYDKETQGWVAAGGNPSPGGGLALGNEQSRFSTYFHALMEVCLAVAEVTLPINMGNSTVGALSSSSAPNLSDSSSSSSSSPGQTPQSPSLLSKRKKVKMKRERTAAAVAAASGKRASASAGSRLSESDSALLNMGGGKPEDMLWFHRGLTLLMILRHLANKDPQGLGVTSDAVTDACQALVGPTAHSRLLVISGIPTHLEESVVRSAIRRACNAHGGLFKDEIYIPLQEEDPKKPKCGAVGTAALECKIPEPERPFPVRSNSPDSSSSVTPAMSVSASASTSQTSICSSSQGVSRTASELSVDQELPPAPVAVPQQQGALDPHTVSSQESLDISLCSTGSLGSLGSLGEPLDSADTASVSDGGSMYTVTSLDNNAVMARPIKGYAVIEVRARAKVEKIRASLFNSSDLIGLSSLEGEEELMEMTNEEILTASSVNQSLFDTQGSSALEDFFMDKSIKGDKLVPGARDVLTDIFKSCVHSEQMLSLTPAKPIKVSDIYLSKEQINAQTPGNLLHVFFTNVRPPKKVLEDQLTQILRKYGVSKPNKSKYSKASKEQHQGKVVSTKRPITKPPTKEKSVLNTVSRTALSEKKPIVKPKSPEKSRPEEKDSEKSPTKKQEVPEEKYLTLEGFHRFAVDRAKQDIRSVWRAILACGYDLHFERCTCIDTRHAQKACRRWSLEMDVALVQYVNRLCRHLAITPARLHPHEVYLDPADTADPRVSCLLNVPMESLRLRFALLQSLNNTLETFFLPLVELRATDTYQHSIASMLREAKGLVFYDTKVAVMNRVLNATVQRTADHAAPEITLDPLEIVGGEIRSSENTYFCQAARQLACVPSSQLCVKLASGGDPTYAFNIRFTGEEVHGTSGSFRHFLWQVCKELQSSALSLLLPCPSSAANRNKGKYILTPSPITYAEEQLLHFFGQLLGIAIRADVPLPLDLLPSFWKGLVGEVLDEDTDLQEADLLTSNYIKKFESVNDEAELDALCAEITSQHHSSESPESPNKPCCKFTYVTMMGDEVELCSGGRNITVGWENKDMYASAIRSLRMRELQSSQCMTAVRAGLDSIIPLQLLTMLTPLEMELRTCGLPYINLEFLKAHTMYQVGLMETDQHIEFFWTALEMFTQEELCKFIKFACNQERIPFTCPCKDGGPDTAHVPPYPMKIAPPDGAAGSPDSRYIRVETCMFMIKLPQYSSLEVMLEKLRYAIHYREDPLSG
nr:PREDICTED: probable E3 ubiquitin-protein ligase HECTD4 [Lepisosteus oculatus]